MPLFECVADEYDAARPPYPSEIFDALGPIAGLSVLDVGAGTGIASRQLLERSASVVAIDHGREMLRRAARRSPGLSVVVADGNALPVRADSVDLVCFAQAWHWLDTPAGALEAHRVLRPGGRFAAWWSHARADGTAWFDDYWTAISQACHGVDKDQRDIDWGPTMTGGGLFDVDERVIVGWERHLTVEQFMTEVATYSYVAALPSDERVRLLTHLRSIVRGTFDHTMDIRYETWLWIADAVRPTPASRSTSD